MRLLKSSAVVGFWTLASRVLGFVRDIFIARYLGTAGPVEAFIVAFRIPNLFRRLVAEGAFQAAFVPLFSKTLEKHGREAAMAFADRVFSVLVWSLLVFTVLAEIFMPEVITVIAPGFRADRPELFDLAVLLTRITFPYLICMAIFAMMSGMLNSVYKFAAAAAAPVLLNLVLVLALIFGADWFETAAHTLSWGVLVAGIGQFIWLGWSAHRAGLSLRLPRPRLTPDVKRLLKLMVPGAIGAGMMQINLLVGTLIASFVPAAVSYLYYADRVYQFPLGMIGIAIGTALLPELSRTLAAEPKSAVGVQNRAIEYAMLLTLPAAAALIVVAEPVILVMFQRGAFTLEAASATADVLAIFATGLPAFVLIKVLNPGFFARHDTTTPVIFAVISMVANIAIAVALMWPPFGLPGLGYLGIPLATSVAAWINAILLIVFLLRRNYWEPDARIARRLPAIVLAAVLMGAGLIPLAGLLEDFFAGRLWLKIAGMVMLVAAGVAVYFAICFVTGAAKPGDFTRFLRRRAVKKEAGTEGVE